MPFDQNKPAASSALVSADMRNNFQHLKNAISKEHNWNDVDPNATTHNLDAMNITVSGSTQRDTVSGADYTTGDGNISTLYNHTVEGIAANTYSLQSLLQELINRSHRHSVESRLSNCNCNCITC